MDFEDTRRDDPLGYDEKTETWYVQSREGRPLQLTRQSLTRLVQLYNSIHKGSALVLLEQREVRRLEETRQRHSETLRDLYLFLDRKERRRPFRLLRRFLGATARLFATLARLLFGRADETSASDSLASDSPASDGASPIGRATRPSGRRRGEGARAIGHPPRRRGVDSPPHSSFGSDRQVDDSSAELGPPQA